MAPSTPESGSNPYDNSALPESLVAETGFQMIQDFYQKLQNSPDNLWSAFRADSTFVRAKEAEPVEVLTGAVKILAHMILLGFKANDIAVSLNTIDSQPSLDDGIVIQVIGVMKRGPSTRRFLETFFFRKIASGYYVFSDTCKFLSANVRGDSQNCGLDPSVDKEVLLNDMMVVSGGKGDWAGATCPVPPLNLVPIVYRLPYATRVAMPFVSLYYSVAIDAPHKLEGFYKDDSTLMQGTEHEDAPILKGQPEMSAKLISIHPQGCNYYINDVVGHAAPKNGIVIQVIGESSYGDDPWRKFGRTFVLAPQQQPTGFYILNDIFRFFEENHTKKSLEPPKESSPERPAETPNTAAQSTPKPAKKTKDARKKFTHMAEGLQYAQAVSNGNANGTLPI